MSYPCKKHPAKECDHCLCCEPEPAKPCCQCGHAADYFVGDEFICLECWSDMSSREQIAFADGIPVWKEITHGI